MKNNKKYNPEIVETEGKLIPYRIYMEHRVTLLRYQRLMGDKFTMINHPILKLSPDYPILPELSQSLFYL
jgi:hypothetical protein